MSTRQVLDDVWRLGAFPFWSINAYRVGDLLFDAGTRWETRHFVRALRAHPPRSVALTHVHPDHQGAAKAVCDAFGATLACPRADVAAMEGREPMGPPTRLLRVSSRLFSGPPRPVDQALRDGDMIGDFRVIAAPGHTQGHVIFFRESDRLAIAGDLATNMNLMTLRPGLHEPPRFFCEDWRENRASIRKLVALEPAVVCFGHGPPLRDPQRLREFAAGLG